MFEKGKIYLRINLSITVNEYKLFYRNKDGNIWIEWTIYIHSQTLIVYSQRRKAWKFEFGELKMFKESDTMNLIKYNIIPQGKYENLNREKNKDIDAIKKINLE